MDKGCGSYLISPALFNSLIKAFFSLFISQYRDNMAATSSAQSFCIAAEQFAKKKKKKVLV